MAWWVKCLVYKHRDLNSDPQNVCKSSTTWHLSVTVVYVCGGVRADKSRGLADLQIQPNQCKHSRFKKPCYKLKMKVSEDTGHQSLACTPCTHSRVHPNTCISHRHICMHVCISTHVFMQMHTHIHK